MASDLGEDFYFTPQAKTIFDKLKPDIIKLVHRELVAYRKKQPDVIDRQHIKRIIDLAVQGRTDIARKAYCPQVFSIYRLDTDDQFACAGFAKNANDPEAFSSYRLDSDNQFAVTDLQNDSYDNMRAHIQARIRNLMQTEHHQEWVMQGQTRFRLIVQTPYQFPVSGLQEQLIQAALRFQENAPARQDERELLDNFLNFTYADQLISKGCCASYCEGITSYYPPMLRLLKERASRELAENEQNISYLSPEVFLPVQLVVPMNKKFHTTPKFNAEQSRLVRVDIEHDPDGQGFIPGYGFLGLLPGNLCDKEGDFPLMICHPAKLYLPALVEQYENLLHLAIMAPEDPDQIINLIGAFHYHWAKAMPMARGSAADGEFLAEALYLLHGFNIKFNPTIPNSVDNQVFMYWTLPEFLRNYFKAIRLDNVNKE